MIAEQVRMDMRKGSAIRKMFEEGARLKAIHGAENVFDFSLGNPDLPTPKRVRERLEQIVAEGDGAEHGYMNNAGFLECRTAIAARESRKSGKTIAPEGVIMTVGAAGALCVIFKAILNPGEEVITISPYFGEYRSYIQDNGGVLVDVPTTRPDFQLDVDAVLAAVTPRTKAILINNPNNPTGQIYEERRLAELNARLKALDQSIYTVFDEPYVELVYEGEAQSPLSLFENAIVAYSWSKSLSLAGERIGYIACSPDCADYESLRDALVYCNRTLGYVNAPAIWQRVLATECDVAVDIEPYRIRRDLICEILDRCGFTYTKPRGTFYVFPQAPGGDDQKFTEVCALHRLLVVPGSNFGAPGYFRISYCVNEETIRRSETAFREIAKYYDLI